MTSLPSIPITSSSSSSAIIHLPTSPISPLQPIYRSDSFDNEIGNSKDGGIFLFETERHLAYSNKYMCTLYTVCIFGCWICTIPSIIATIYAKQATKNNEITRAKVMFNIAFILSFLGLVFFAVQAGYLIWFIRYILHRLIKQ